MLLKILLAVAALFVIAIVVVIALAASKPDEFRVERSTVIEAPPEKVYALIEDFRKWEDWSPFEKSDPAMKRTFSGPESGQGAVYEWVGNSAAGEGRIEIVEAVPSSVVALDLHMMRPFDCRNDVRFTLEPQGDATRVAWAMYGPNTFFPGKLMQVFMNVDAMCGGQFEQGLASMKTIAEKDAKPEAVAAR